MKNRFKVGDVITGIMSASERYMITINGVYMKVTKVNGDYIDVEVTGWDPKVENLMREYCIEIGIKYYDLEERFFKKVDEYYTVWDFTKSIVSNNIQSVWVYRADGHRCPVKQIRTFKTQEIYAIQIDGDHRLSGAEVLEQMKDWPLDAKVYLYDEDIFYPISYCSIRESVIDEEPSVRLMLFV